MLDNNIDLCKARAEEQRHLFSILPTQLLIKGTNKGKSLARQLTKKVSKIPMKRQVQVAAIFDSLMTTQKKGSISQEDINFEIDELVDSPYETILHIFGAETAKELVKHTIIIDVWRVSRILCNCSLD